MALRSLTTEPQGHEQKKETKNFMETSYANKSIFRKYLREELILYVIVLFYVADTVFDFGQLPQKKV